LRFRATLTAAETETARKPQLQIGPVAAIDRATRRPARVNHRQPAPAGEKPCKKGASATPRFRAAGAAIGIGRKLGLVPLELGS